MKLTAEDLKTISAALSDGIEWRDSLADSYHRRGPEARLATATADRYERLHVKLLGQPSRHAAERKRMSEMKTVSIFELEDPK